ncbi:MAG: hypothetical protein JXA95_17405 [Spirochaetales bacterium]|nr:hypothetical protein [Spirochaetales bacterium]
MKIKKPVIFVTTVLFAVAACNLSMITGVKIEAKPAVQLSLGERTGLFSDFLNLEGSLDELTREMDGFSVDTSVRDGDTLILNLQQEVLNYDFQELLPGSVSADILILRADVAGQYPDEGEDPIDLSLLNTFLSGDMTLPDITAEVNLDFNAISSDTELSLLLYARYRDNDREIRYLNLIGTDHNGDNIPDEMIPCDTNGTITVNTARDLINDRATEVIFFYEMEIRNTLISIDNSGTQIIQASLDAVMPCRLYAREDTAIRNGGEPAIPAASGDIFGRDSTGDNGGISQYLAMLDSAVIHMTCRNNFPREENAFIGLGIAVSEETEGMEDFFFAEELMITPGREDTVRMEITQAMINRMVRDSSFEPQIEIYFPGPGEYGKEKIPFDGYHRLVKGFDMDIQVWLEMASDVEYTLNF